MCFHNVSDRVESTLVWPQEGNMFALCPIKKVGITFYKMGLKYAIRGHCGGKQEEQRGGIVMLQKEEEGRDLQQEAGEQPQGEDQDG